MKHTMFRRAAAMAALFAALTAAVSCGESAAQPAENTKAVDPVIAESETVTEEAEADTFVMPDLPERNYNGEDFVFFVPGPGEVNANWTILDIYAESQTGEVVTDAVYERNLWLEENFNIKIKQELCAQSVMSTVQKSVNAGDDVCDVALLPLTNGCTLGQKGYVYDLNTLPYMDLSHSWWDQSMYKDMSILGKNYVMTGDCTTADNEATWVLVYNKKIAQELDLDDFYSRVREGTWTVSVFYDYAKQAVQDLDGDGKYTLSDRMGLLTTSNTTQAMIFGCGRKLTTKDSNDCPMFITDLDDLAEIGQHVGAMLSDKTTVNNATGGGNDLRHIYEEGHGLFYGEVLMHVIKMREYDIDFGLIPWPKYDDAQENYYTHVNNGAAKGIIVPTTHADTERTGIIMEAFSAKSVPTVTHAYYNVALSYKYLRDEESIEMLDIILQSRCYDLAYFYDWGSLFSSTMTLIQNKGGAELMSKWESKLTAAEKAMNATIDEFRANN